MSIIVHIDMDAFFASVEQNDNPELRGKPVVVGSPSDRGVIAAASYEARKYGVRSAMPSMVALRLCPGLVFVKHRMSRYSEVSGKIFEIFNRYTERVEPLSVDEAFLDLTGQTDSLEGAADIAGRIKSDIYSDTGLRASAGISYNKFLAKLASGMKKPDGLVVINCEEAGKILPLLPVEEFYGIGKVTAEKLHRYGIHNGSDLMAADLEFLTRNFGKAGYFYYDISRGRDDRRVETGRERKSVGAELTFERDLTTRFEIIAELYKIERILWERIGNHGRSGRTVTLKVKFDDFSQVTKSRTLLNRINDFRQLHSEVTKIRDEIDFHRRKVRLMGVTVSNLTEEEGEAGQLDLWEL